MYFEIFCRLEFLLNVHFSVHPMNICFDKNTHLQIKMNIFNIYCTCVCNYHYDLYKFQSSCKCILSATAPFIYLKRHMFEIQSGQLYTVRLISHEGLELLSSFAPRCCVSQYCYSLIWRIQFVILPPARDYSKSSNSQLF